MKTHFALTLVSALAFVAVGCGSARVVKRTPTGGVLALEGSRDKAMENAHAQMGNHCQGPYTIVEEGEHVVGVDSAAGEETYVAEDGALVTEGSQSTREATEWRVRYVCGNQMPAAAPAPQPAPAPAPPAGYEEPAYDQGYGDQGQGYDEQGYDDQGYDDSQDDRGYDEPGYDG